MNVIQIYDTKRRSDPFADHRAHYYRRLRIPYLQHLCVGTYMCVQCTAAALQMSPTEFIISKCIGSKIYNMGIMDRREYNKGGAVIP